MTSPEIRREKKGEWEERSGRTDWSSAPISDTEYDAWAETPRGRKTEKTLDPGGKP